MSSSNCMYSSEIENRFFPSSQCCSLRLTLYTWKSYPILLSFSSNTVHTVTVQLAKKKNQLKLVGFSLLSVSRSKGIIWQNSIEMKTLYGTARPFYITRVYISKSDLESWFTDDTSFPQQQKPRSTTAALLCKYRCHVCCSYFNSADMFWDSVRSINCFR